MRLSPNGRQRTGLPHSCMAFPEQCRQSSSAMALSYRVGFNATVWMRRYSTYGCIRPTVQYRYLNDLLEMKCHGGPLGSFTMSKAHRASPEKSEMAFSHNLEFMVVAFFLNITIKCRSMSSRNVLNRNSKPCSPEQLLLLRK